MHYDWCMGSFFERVKKLVRSNGTTIGAVAVSGGITLGSYNTLRKRGLLPRADVVQKIAKTLNVSMEFLLTGEEGVQISPADAVLLSRARKWASLLNDLEMVEPAVAGLVVATIHAAGRGWAALVRQGSG